MAAEGAGRIPRREPETDFKVVQQGGGHPVAEAVAETVAVAERGIIRCMMLLEASAEIAGEFQTVDPVRHVGFLPVVFVETFLGFCAKLFRLLRGQNSL